MTNTFKTNDITRSLLVSVGQRLCPLVSPGYLILSYDLEKSFNLGYRHDDQVL